jgi:hypothetical protein
MLRSSVQGMPCVLPETLSGESLEKVDPKSTDIYKLAKQLGYELQGFGGERPVKNYDGVLYE